MLHMGQTGEFSPESPKIQNNSKRVIRKYSVQPAPLPFLVGGLNLLPTIQKGDA